VTDADRRFAEQAIRRKDLFKNLSVLSVIVGALLGAYFAVESSRDPNFEWGVRAVLVVMILLSGRQNLRQYKYARVMEGLLGSEAPEE
jgi:uncharacterized membrane protein (UPF0136 family)